MEWVARGAAGQRVVSKVVPKAAARAAPVKMPAWAEVPLQFSTVALVVLNLLDGLFTLSFLQLGVAEEINPVMRWAYEANPLVFMGLKFLCVHAGVLVLAAHQELKAARWVLRGAVGVYGLLVLYHLAFLAHVVLR